MWISVGYAKPMPMTFITLNFNATADGDDIIDGHIDKNVESNLVPLCKKCHTDVHNNKLQIDGYKQTSKGIKLQYTSP